MKKILFLLISAITLQSCDDGDLIVTTFDFENTALQVCGGPDVYVFYKIGSNTEESISLRVNTTQDIFFEDESTAVGDYDLVFTLDGTDNFVNYRIFNSTVTNSYFCNSVPPTTPEVTENYVGASGTAVLSARLTYNDDDGVDTVDSSDLLAEGTADLDGDGIPNFYDFDDDGDNVPTSVELGIDVENPEPRDTDEDNIPDYQDEDDDGDGILTRNESNDGDLDPTNDRTENNIPDYLNRMITVETINNAYIPHVYDFINTIAVLLNNVVLSNGEEQITQETLSLGTKENVMPGTVIITPAFD